MKKCDTCKKQIRGKRRFYSQTKYCKECAKSAKKLNIERANKKKKRFNCWKCGKRCYGNTCKECLTKGGCKGLVSRWRRSKVKREKVIKSIEERMKPKSRRLYHV